MQVKIDPPNERQAEFWRAREKYVCYGGARGGGKSWALRKKALLLAMRYPGIKILILRRSYPELRQNHILPMMADALGIGAYRDIDKTMRYQGGSVVQYGYLDSDRDLMRYQGQEYDIIMLDEATQFEEQQFRSMAACLRGVNDYPKRVYLTCNPGGVGHGWVKRLFVDRLFGPGELESEYRPLIKATVYDNKALMDADPEYVRQLEALPEDTRRMWLDGNWNVYAGQYFSEFRTDVHTYEDYPLPHTWRRYMAMDYGLDMLAAYWIAVDGFGRAYVYRELYEPGQIISQAAEKIKAADEVGGCYIYLAPPDLWNRRQETGKSVAELFFERGITLAKASAERVGGWLNLREWLRPVTDEFGEMRPRLMIAKSCKNLIRCLPLLQHDPKDPSDTATEPHEYTHGPDALRYFVNARPLAMDVQIARDADDPPDWDKQLSNFLDYSG